jgi:hypothetical protein
LGEEDNVALKKLPCTQPRYNFSASDQTEGMVKEEGSNEGNEEKSFAF